MGENDKKKEEVLTATVAEEASHATPATHGTGGGGTSGSKQSRPKRARTKAEKKDVQESTSRFHCNYCGRDLSLQIRARCAVCPDYDSCLDCFSVGASLKPHEPSHAYRLIEVVHTPIFQQGWSADEEDKLLEGLEMYGVGNWEQVAKSVGSKNAYETEQHFLKVYLQSHCAPLPDPTKLLPAEKPPSEKGDDCDPKALRVMHKHQQEDAAGWMPKRQDFVYEWDNEAEEILGDMEISEEDSAKDKELKLQVLEIYNTKLDERKKRKDFVVERGFTDFKGYLANEKKRPREEKEIREKLRVFSRFLAPADMDKFVQGILEERSVRLHLDAFREGRRNGITSLAEFNRSLPPGKSKSRYSVSAPSESGGGAGGTQSGTGASRRNKRPNGDAVMEDSSNNGNGMNELKASILGPEPDVSQQPGAELLSRTELSLCTSLKITVHQYMIVKEVLIRESARLGSLRKKEAKAMVRLDQTKVFKIYDYVLACGWIRSGASIGGNSSSAARSNVAVTTPNGTRPS